jgi:hypothetical protein
MVYTSAGLGGDPPANTVEENAMHRLKSFDLTAG